jgi:diguanylate cyclase (GGDEF)-like protein
VSAKDGSCPVAIIADDEDLGRLLLAEAASTAGLTPRDFDNGKDALDAALASEVSVVLLDVDMPGMTGVDVCRRLRREPRFDSVPIVMVTGQEDAGAIRLAFEAGATDFIRKPVNWTLLPYRLEYILRNATQVRTLAERELQVRTLVEALPDRLWIVSADGEVRWSPQAGANYADAKTADAHEPPPAIAPPPQMPQVSEAIRATAADGLPRKLDYGESSGRIPECSYELRFSRREGGDVVVVRRDTSERTAAAKHIERLAYFDSLTDLPNRQGLLEAADRYLIEAAESQEGVALIYLDLNGFKRINDAFGHPVGDAVLRTVAGKLAATVKNFPPANGHVLLARFGGDEFVIVLRHAAARSTAIELADACCVTLQEAIAYEGIEFHATPSIGVACYPEDGADVTTILKHADTAMYQAKTGAAAPVAVYSPAMSSRLRDWFDLEARLRRAVQDDGLALHFQPKFRLADDRIVGVEALLRWCDADFGEIMPAQFVAIAEESGLIIDMGAWVIRAACRQARAWVDQGLTIPVAINISGKELLHGDPAHLLELEARNAGILPSLIEIEITESLLIKDSPSVRNTLDRFRSLGCPIALDDFGTGFSSLAYITRFPPDRIKIDKTFVKHVDESPSDAAIANAILSLGASLNLVVTAEGIERSGQLEWLRRRGCQEAQGFLLGRPMPARALEDRFLRPLSLATGSFIIRS